MMQVELHRHLDVSIRLATLLELMQERGLEGQSTSLDSFQKKIVLTHPLSSLSEVLETFTTLQNVLDRPEVLDRIAFETIEDCHREGTDWVELRFSPSFVCEKSKLPWVAALDGFYSGIQRGLQKYPKMKAGLICIASRDYGVESVDETVEFFLKHDQNFVGLDLAGNEEEFRCRLFESSFKKAQKWGANITIHAGEASGPENVWEAIELLGAKRIGHGIQSFKDPFLVEALRERKICLEMCLTSNWITQASPELKNHPILDALRSGVPVSLSTDDPTIFGKGLDQELTVARDIVGLDSGQIQKCMKNAAEFSFLNK